jgi:hypothetical protein
MGDPFVSVFIKIKDFTTDACPFNLELLDIILIAKTGGIKNGYET